MSLYLTLSCRGPHLVLILLPTYITPQYWSDRDASSDIRRSTSTAFRDGIKLDGPTGIDRVAGIQSRPIEIA